MAARPRQLTFGGSTIMVPISDAGRPLHPVQRRPQQEWEREPSNSEIYSVDVASGALTALTNRVGPDAAPAISPDGKRVAYLGYRRQISRLRECDALRDGPQWRERPRASLPASIAAWTTRNGPPTAARSYVQYDDHGLSRVARVAPGRQDHPGRRRHGRHRIRSALFRADRSVWPRMELSPSPAAMRCVPPTFRSRMAATRAG